ncbi:Rne/Rng family ribonuclease [Pseudooceanicola atlanticus]|uniref:Ribonuclease E n=1 Tax=Pseudooceanicola atlanticus TaxID=1461694 RepID=A0A0A0ECK9_9RHOB|nr:ribonuclease E/G [Pseudooceanicola atlanticus]KGM48691.1 ribonuclease [Pseudooceanicola atlanticus]
MAKKMLIDATHAEETRVVVVDGNKVEEFDFESENKRQLAGNIYLAKVTRVEPSLQAAFVDYGGNRHGFLAFSEIHPDYYQIPVADREALMEEERAYAEAQKAKDEAEDEKKKSRSRRRPSAKAEKVESEDAVTSAEAADGEISGMETIDLEDGAESDEEGLSPMETVAETPVEEPAEDTEAEAADDDDEDGETGSKASDRDSEIESVADDDDQEDIRPVRKPRPRRYKIQEVIKVRQILLVQVVKEERGNKGAALTTYLSLAGRYCVLMPNTARGGGISRKITNAADRKKLKETAAEIDVPQGAGLIVRTAGAKRTKTEIKRDYEYLQRMWEQIRELTLKSIAPAKIYEEGDLIKRSIRDLYSRDIDEVLVEGERGYRIAKDFMKMIMPSHAKNVKNYHDAMPLFARYQVESYLGGMFNPTVQLKSGGYIVIGVTEALVAIDVNSGRATKEGSIEETATKTNLEAAEEVARQLRLRDLAGLIVIDFIDMDERKNNAAVEKKLKDKLKTDRARIQVGRISGFGLLEMSRQRLRPGMLEASTQPCPACHGTGLIRSDDSMALNILRQIEEEGVRGRSREVLVKCPVDIANYLMNQKREHVAQIEARYGLSVRIEGDPHLISPDFSVEKFKTATRKVAEVVNFVSADASFMDSYDEAEEAVEEAEGEDNLPGGDAPEQTSEEPKPKKKRRRRRRRKSSKDYSENGSGDDQANDSSQGDAGASDQGEATEAKSGEGETAKSDDSAGAEAATAEETPAEKPKRTRTRSRKKPEPEAAEATADDASVTGEASEADAPADAEAAPAKPKRTRSRAKPKTEAAPAAEAEPAGEVAADAVPAAEPDAAAVDAAPESVAEPVADAPAEPVAEAPADPVADASVAEEPAAEPVAEDAPAPEAPADAPAEEPKAAEPVPEREQTPEAAMAGASTDTPAEPDKPKKRGWWSIGKG